MKKVCKPVVSPDSQLGFRIGLTRKRHESFPMNNLDFILMDLEQPAAHTRHASQCVGDLTGRALEFLSISDGVDGKTYPRIHELFNRILFSRNEDGTFGKLIRDGGTGRYNADVLESSISKLAAGLIRYYETFGDMRALNAARGLADYLCAHADEVIPRQSSAETCNFNNWTALMLARVYENTGDEKYLNTVKRIYDSFGGIDCAHSHSFLTMLRGFQIMARVTGDSSWADKAEGYRKAIIKNEYESADGSIPEVFPSSERNEGCSIADWLLLNLHAGFIYGDDSAYEKAEHILYNALAFNQLVTGGFGHRAIIRQGYGVGEVQEAWWCCTQTAGVAMTELARHVVTLADDGLHINFLVSGDYTLTAAENNIHVRIATEWPAKAEAVISVEGLPDGMPVFIRQPSFVKEIKRTENVTNGIIRILWSGEIGYYLLSHGGKYSLMNGAVMLAPCAYTWGGEVHVEDGKVTVPEGYRSKQLPSIDASIMLPEKDSNGFYHFNHEPFPLWSFFEEGVASRCSVGKASANVELRFWNGEKHTVRFWPLCANTSTLLMYEVPVAFDIVTE